MHIFKIHANIHAHRDIHTYVTYIHTYILHRQYRCILWRHPTLFRYMFLVCVVGYILTFDVSHLDGCFLREQLNNHTRSMHYKMSFLAVSCPNGWSYLWYTINKPHHVVCLPASFCLCSICITHILINWKLLWGYTWIMLQGYVGVLSTVNYLGGLEFARPIRVGICQGGNWQGRLPLIWKNHQVCLRWFASNMFFWFEGKRSI